MSKKEDKIENNQIKDEKIKELQIVKGIDKLAGTNLGNYVLDEIIGQGALSTVYKAHHKNMPKTPLALKVFNNKTILDKFKQEAVALDGLVHDNIIGLRDLCFEGKNPYIVLEFAEQSLRDKLESKTQNWSVAVNTIIDLAGALSYAHENGVVHRDIKPENILFVNGEVKLSDFNSASTGLTETLECIADEQLRESLYSQISNSSNFAGGTLAYMSPEQIMGGEARAKSDVYSLASVFYESLTGKLPHGNYKKVSELNDSIPNWIDGVIDKALVTNPNQRSGAKTFLESLKKGLEGKLDSQIPKFEINSKPDSNSELILELDPEIEKRKFWTEKRKENMNKYLAEFKNYSLQVFKWATVPIWGPIKLIKTGLARPYPETDEIMVFLGLMLGAVYYIGVPMLTYTALSPVKSQIASFLKEDDSKIAFRDNLSDSTINYLIANDVTDGDFEIKSFKDPRSRIICDIHWVSENELIYSSIQKFKDVDDVYNIHLLNVETGDLNFRYSSSAEIENIGFNPNTNQILFKSGGDVYALQKSGGEVEKLKLISSKLPFEQKYNLNDKLEIASNGGAIEIELKGGSFAEYDLGLGFFPAWNPFTSKKPNTSNLITAPSETIAPIQSDDVAVIKSNTRAN